jgi:hypothetical protein
VEVIVTTYDAEGLVTGFRQSVLVPSASREALLPGAELAFSLLLTSHGDVPDDFVVSAVGRVAEDMTLGG